MTELAYKMLLGELTHEFAEWCLAEREAGKIDADETPEAHFRRFVKIQLAQVDAWAELENVG